MATLIFSAVDNPDVVLLLRALKLENNPKITAKEDLKARNLLVSKGDFSFSTLDT